MHPAELTLLESMVRYVSKGTTSVQVILATQSARFLDQFDPDDVVVADRVKGATEFSRLDADKLEVWLEDYSLGELWEMNDIGGRPTGTWREGFAVTRLLICVEGQTEEDFVEYVLAPHLYTRGYTAVAAKLMGTAISRANRGGVKAWDDVLKDIVNKLRGDRGLIVSTMVDYYGMPRDWPGRAAVPPSGETPSQIAVPIEQGMSDAVVGEMGSGFNAGRFVPYVMMHEFEALLFSNCNRLAIGMGKA